MARNNEAKIKFTAETREFNDAIKASDKTMANLRAELKLNETQMQDTGRTVEGLEREYSLLDSQMQASRAKTEALSGKIEAATRIFGENSNEVLELKTKLAQAQTAEERVRQALEKCNRELTEQKAAAKEAESATKRLTDTIEKQQSEVDALKDEYKEAVLQYGETSDEAKALAKKLKTLSGELKESKGKLEDADRAADKLDKSLEDAGNAAKDSADGFTVMKGAVADLVSEAVQWGVDQLGEFVGYLAELPEATRELRQDMATLETSFHRAGFSTEQATQTWKDLYTVFGEDDRAVETANHISKMAKNQKDLNQWVTITKGVWGTYQDSLPVEGLAEASNETAKTGKVTGVLADALNWSGEAATMFSKYMSEDVTTAEDAFNEALKGCTTEQERQALITETLTKLYGGAAGEYEKASGAQIEAKETAAEAALAQSKAADAVEPATTAWEGLKTELLVGVTPALTTICDGLEVVFNWLQEHPAVMYTLIGVLGALATALTVAAVAQAAMNLAMLMSPTTWIILGIVAAVAALIAIVVVIISYWDQIKEGCINAWESVKSVFSSIGDWINTNVIQPVANFFTGLWDGIKNTFSGVGSWFSEKFTAAKNGITNAWSSVKNFFSGIWNGIKNTFSSVGSWFRDKFTAAKNGITNAWSSVKNFFSNTWSGIKNTFSNIGGWFRDKFTAAKDAIMNVWNKIKLKLPHIKLPHFSVKGKFSLDPPSVPKLAVDWYAKGAIFTKPTIFGTANGYKGVGDAGYEAVLPIDRLQGFISNAIEKSAQTADIRTLAHAIENLADRPIGLYVNGRQFATATAGDTDSVSGMRSTFKSRGLIVD